MSKVVDFTIPGPPVTQGSVAPGITKAGQLYTRHANSHDVKKWREVAQTVMLAARKGKRFEKGTAVAVTVNFVCPTPKKSSYGYPTKDVDKFLRCLFDALTGPLLADDSQIVEVSARKTYGLEPRTEVRLIAYVQQKAEAHA